MKTERVQRIMIVGLLLVVGLLGYAQTSKRGIAQTNVQEPCQVGAYQVHDLKTTLGEGTGAVEYTATLLFDTRDGRTWYRNVSRMVRHEKQEFRLETKAERYAG